MTHCTRGKQDHDDHGQDLRERQISRPLSESLLGYSSIEYQMPQYFIVRPNSTMQTASGIVTTKEAMVPLIPRDQLPPWLEIVGIPRELNVEQTKGSKNLGEVPKTFNSYEVYFPFSEHDANARGLPMAAGHDQREYQSPGSSSESQAREVVPVDVSEHNKTPKNDSQNTKNHKRSHIPFDSNGSGTGSGPPNSTMPLSSGIPPLAALTPATTLGFSSSHPGPQGSDLVSPPGHPASKLLRNPIPSSDGGYSPAQPYTFRSAGVTPHRDNNDNNTPPGMVTRNRSHSRGNSTGIVYCRHFAHHGTCKWGRTCFYVHGMPQTVEGLREVGLENIPMWYKSQRTGFAMGMAMARRWGGNHNNSGAGGGGLMMTMDDMGMLDAGIADMEGGAMTQQEWNELRARLERQDAAEQRAKAARDKQSGRAGKSKFKGKMSEGTTEFQATLLGKQNYDFAPAETLETRSEDAEKEVTNLETQINAKAKSVNGLGKGKTFPIENLMDL